MIKFTIKRNEILALRHLCSTDTSRYILNGIHFECTNGKLLLVATDGRLMGIVKAENPGGPEDFKFTASCSLIRTLGSDISVELNETTVSFCSGGPRIVEDLMDGNYPAWRTVIPKGEQYPTHFSFDISLFNRFVKVASSFRKPPMIRLISHSKDSLSAYSVHIASIPNFYGVLMPCRGSEFQMPDWL